jgi:diadenosine tetraphosphate (Ap4A) HIT family hydrolase
MEGCVFCAIVGGRALHVVPRYRADELQVMWQATPVADADLAAARARILSSAR